MIIICKFRALFYLLLYYISLRQRRKDFANFILIKERKEETRSFQCKVEFIAIIKILLKISLTILNIPSFLIDYFDFYILLFALHYIFLYKMRRDSIKVFKRTKIFFSGGNKSCTVLLIYVSNECIFNYI